MAREPLHDGHGRAIGDLRVSVTDRCNFRCQWRKELKHHVGEPGFIQPARTMSAIGG
jgi:hypothetical protein